MKISILLPVICLFSLGVCGQPATDSSHLFLLVVRYKTDMKMPTDEVLKLNAQHWGAFIGQLAKSGKLVSGIRPENNGLTMYGTGQKVENKPFSGSGETVSSILVIRAADESEAETIAKKCPIFEMDGSIEIRKVQNMQ
jgi:hypothetical protein